MNRGMRLDIQALRAIAVVAVVIYHLWPNRLTGGFMGVDIFFVLSGFLMTSTIMRDSQTVVVAKNKLRSTGSFLANFYARRIKRLIPAASVTLLATLGMAYITGNLSLIQKTAEQMVSSALFYQNWFLAKNSVDYLADKNPSALQHFWSLSLEEQFYLVWPVALLVLMLVSANFFIVYKRERVSSLAIIPVLALVALFFLYGYQLTKTDQSLAYFVTPARVWQLLIGGVIAFLPTLKSYDLRLLLPWLGTAMIGYALYKWDGTNFPGWHAMVPTLGTALIIYAGGLANESKWSFENLLRFKPIQWLGDISYSLYLWHWPLIILLPVIFFVDLESHPRAFFIKIGILIASLVAAFLSYRYVEQSTRHVKLSNRYVYVFFVACISLTAGLGYFTANRVEATIQTSVNEMRALVMDDSNKCIGAKSIFNDCERSLDYIDDRFSQIGSHDTYDYILQSKEYCSSYSATSYSEQINTICQVGDSDSTTEITIFGDSHAQHWINTVDKIGRENKIKFHVAGVSYCFGNIKFSDYSENCMTRFQVYKNSGILDRSKAILVSMWHNSNLNRQPGNNAHNAINVLHELTNNDNIYLLEDTPFIGPEGGPGCYILRQSCKYDAIDATGIITKDSTDLIELGLIDKDRVVGVKDMFCDNEFCYSNIGGISVYRDKSPFSFSMNSHMTASFAYSTWPILEKKFKDAGIID